MNLRKKAGLILSGIGVFLYLLSGNIYIFLLYPTPVIYSLLLLFTGAISLVGTIVGVKVIKKGGAVILISIPISIFLILILNFILEYYVSYTFNEIVFFVLYPIPYPHSVFVIIGGIQCLKSSDD